MFRDDWHSFGIGWMTSCVLISCFADVMFGIGCVKIASHFCPKAQSSQQQKGSITSQLTLCVSPCVVKRGLNWC